MSGFTVNDTFVGSDSDFEGDDDVVVVSEAENESEPIEVIISRVIFALLVSTSLVLNLLLLLAVIRYAQYKHHVVL